MNLCSENHNPTYLIKYISGQNSEIQNELLVCDQCFGKQEFFGIADEIESIVSLQNNFEAQLKIDHLDIMTRTVSRKLKTYLLIH